MRLVTFSYSSPVITYLRWDRESDSACCCYVCEGGDAPLLYGGEVGEEHVYTACPAIRLLGSTAYMGDRCGML